MVSKDNYLSTGAAAEFLGVHPNTLRRWEAEGIIHCRRANGKYRKFRRSDLEMLYSTNITPDVRSENNPSGLDDPTIVFNQDRLNSMSDIPF